jgi:hypothetical protein
MGSYVHTRRNFCFISNGKELASEPFFFHKILQDYSLAVRWFSLCRDYNRKQVECSVQLARVLLLVNRFDLAQIELENLLQQEVQERLMLNMLHTVTCAVPSLVMDINSIKFSNSMLSRGDAWFQLLMVRSSFFNFAMLLLLIRYD